MMDLDDYIELHIDEEPDYLKRLEKETHLRRVHGRMCSGHLQGRILKMLVGMVSPRRVLELGTFTGYSALCIAEGLSSGAKLVTVEAFDELEPVIRAAIAESEYGDRIELMIGDAQEVCLDFEPESFDMMFVDADKRKYPEYYALAMKLLRPGGYLLADNVLWDGHVAEAGRADSQTEGVRRFNEMAKNDPGAEVVILPVRDGISIIRKRKAREFC